MKRTLLFFALLLAGSIANPLHAQESAQNEIEFVKQLRNKGWHDLARERIDMLRQRNDPTLNALLPLELANINLAEARQKDPQSRLAAFTATRGLLEEFIAKNKGTPQAALAAAQLARISSYHAQALLSQAMREDDARSRHDKARPAEAKFIVAGKDLEAAIKDLEAAIKNASTSDQKAILQQELRQARFDVAINLFDQARTYINRSKLDVDLKRTETIDKAKAAFLQLRSDESSEVGWLASAWLMKCAMETTNAPEITKYHDFIINRKAEKTAQPAIQAAVRLVRYFAMQDQTLPRPDDPETIGNNSLHVNAKMSPQQRLRAVQVEGEAWIKAYSGYLKTYEGQGVLYELAMAYYTDGQIEKNQKVANVALDKAVVVLDKLAEMDGEHAETARQIALSIKFKRIGNAAELKTFDEFMMLAMIKRRAVIETLGKLEDNANKLANAKDEAAKKTLTEEKKTIDADRKKYLQETIGALSKALGSATSKTPVQKVDDALYYMSGAYLAAGDPYRAVIAAESLGRTRATRRSPEGAATAIATYSALADRHPDDASIRQRLQAMTQFVLEQKAWANEPVTSVANYHMGMTLQKEGKLKDAIAHLEKVSPDFADYIYVLGQIFFISETARENTENKKDQKEYLEIAKRALAKMPKLDAKNESPSVIAMYFYAKLEMSKFMYNEAIEDLNAKETLKAVKKCTDMKAYVAGLRAEFGQVPPNAVTPKTRDQLEFTMQIMMKYGDLGIAETKFRGTAANRFDEVIAATKTVVDGVIEKAKAVPAGEPIRLKDYRVTGDILGLALRANVQKGEVAKGKAILDVLQRLSGTNENDKPGPVVAILLNDIAGQIKTMVADKDHKLDETKKNYTAFLDVIAKEYDAKGHDNTSTNLLARAYSSLGLPCKAATLYSKFKAPDGIEFKKGDKKIEKKKDETAAETAAREKKEEEANRYWGVQVEYVQALRGCKDKESMEKAEKAVNALIAHPFATYKIPAMMERNFLFEDTERYRLAFSEWSKFLENESLKRSIADPKVQQMYFTGYFYRIRTVNRMAVHDAKLKDPQKYIEAGAKWIVDLEYAKGKEGWEIVRPKIYEYLNEPEADKLKKAYEAKKAERQKTSSAGSLLPHFEVAKSESTEGAGTNQPWAERSAALCWFVAAPSVLKANRCYCPDHDLSNQGHHLS